MPAIPAMPAIDSRASTRAPAAASAAHPSAHPPLRSDIDDVAVPAVVRRLLIVDENWW